MYIEVEKEKFHCKREKKNSHSSHTVQMDEESGGFEQLEFRFGLNERVNLSQEGPEVAVEAKSTRSRFRLSREQRDEDGE